MTSLSHVQRVRMLYKTILRLHRGLPEEMRTLGDVYVRDEFRRHKKCTPTEVSVFMNEWTVYAVNLTQQLGLRGPRTAKPLGLNLDPKDFDNFSDDQLHQLYELMLAATGKTEENLSEKK